MTRITKPLAVAMFLVAAATIPRTALAQNDAQTCIAIAMPSASGVDGDATAFAMSLRDLFVGYLTGPTLRAITLDSRLPSQAVEEARQKQCGFVLLTSITRKHDDGNGFGKALGRAAGTAAVYGVPYGSTATTAAARGAAIAGGQAISGMAETTKAKDEVSLEYRIGTVDTALRASPKTEKAKAKSDQEDLLTPLVEKASEAAAAAVLKK